MTTSSSLWQHHHHFDNISSSSCSIADLVENGSCFQERLQVLRQRTQAEAWLIIIDYHQELDYQCNYQRLLTWYSALSKSMIITTSLIINMIISRSGSRIIIISRLLTIIDLVISTSRSIITIIAIIRIIIRSCWLPKLVFHYIIFSNIEPLPSFCQCVHFGGNKHKNVHEIYNSKLTCFQPEEINRVTSNV